MINKAIVPAAGLGTRLLPVTKEQPKEMLPIFSRGIKNKIFTKPILQAIYENIFNSDIREFCFIVGRTKRIIKDHFTPDFDYIQKISNKNNDAINELQHFYNILEKSRIVWLNQPKPKGFGDAVYMAKNFVGQDEFMVHAGDAMVLSKKTILKDLIEIHKKYNADVTILTEREKDPSKYGVIVSEEVEKRVHKVLEIREKPERPKSNLIVIAIYIFNSKIFNALEKTKPDKNNEKQLTDAIQILIEQGSGVYALELEEGEKHIDIGNVERYREALQNII